MMTAMLLCALSVSVSGSLEPDMLQGDLPPIGWIWLETAGVDRIEQGWGMAQAGHSVEGNGIVLGGKAFKHGVGTHAESHWVVDLKKAALEFVSIVGVDDEILNRAKGSVVFEVWADGNKVADSGVMHAGEPAKQLAADLRGVKTLTLVAASAGDGIDRDHADWAGCAVRMQEGTDVKPETVQPDDSGAQAITLDDPASPVIHPPRITGATPGRPFLFRIPATGEGPLVFSARGLPKGLSLDPRTGIISGALEREGSTEVTLRVAGPKGKAKARLRIVGGQQALALTPPMGWNSWYVWSLSVDDARVRAAADALVSTGLAAHGYQYLCIDDCWQDRRGKDGRVKPNKRFPDMKALADYIHSKGLKFGIYSSPGPKTCAGYTGSYEHEDIDARTYEEWGVDFLKYDWCSYADLAKKDDPEELRKPYRIMRDALAACNRDIVYSLCQYGMGEVWKWGAEVDGNLWRTTGDMGASWGSMMSIARAQAGLEAYAGPGHWNDPDMIVVGPSNGWSGQPIPCPLNRNEQIAYMTFWSVLAAPLIISTDLASIDQFTLALLTNDEVLEANQDVAGRQGRRVVHNASSEVWAKPLSDGTLAVALFNLSPFPLQITASWADLGLKGKQPVRDLWLHKDLGVMEEAYVATVQAHGAVYVKVGKPRR